MYRGNREILEETSDEAEHPLTDIEGHNEGKGIMDVNQ